MNAFTTSYGTTIPAHVMQRVRARLEVDDDWQEVATDELRGVIPERESDVEEMNEVLSQCQ